LVESTDRREGDLQDMTITRTSVIRLGLGLALASAGAGAAAMLAAWPARAPLMPSFKK
jgi:hypothetical protein